MKLRMCLDLRHGHGDRFRHETRLGHNARKCRSAHGQSGRTART